MLRARDKHCSTRKQSRWQTDCVGNHDTPRGLTQRAGRERRGWDRACGRTLSLRETAVLVGSRVRRQRVRWGPRSGSTYLVQREQPLQRAVEHAAAALHVDVLRRVARQRRDHVAAHLGEEVREVLRAPTRRPPHTHTTHHPKSNPVSRIHTTRRRRAGGRPCERRAAARTTSGERKNERTKRRSGGGESPLCGCAAHTTFRTERGKRAKPSRLARSPGAPASRSPADQRTTVHPPATPASGSSHLPPPGRAR